MKLQNFLFLFVLLSCLSLQGNTAKQNNKNLVENLTDFKDLKKLLRTKTNVLVCFYNSYKKAQSILTTLGDVAKNVKGEGVIAVINCSGEAKKLCKKLKITSNEPFVIKHYKDGEFNKDYDRKYNEKSITQFMKDPTGDLPWEEDDSAKDVLHIPDPGTLARFLKREGRPILILFYAPWCGYCKTLKPEYAQAATELKDHSVLAAVDVNRPENAHLRTQYNITGFPTMLYFLNGHVKFPYEGENKRAALVQFMHNPVPPQVKVKEPEWSDSVSDVIHLTSLTFDSTLKASESVLVMFYAPWCGHCKRMKPEYEAAAAQMKEQGVKGILAAVDATKDPSVASRFNVKGYPTVIYFSKGEQLYSPNVREAAKIVDFMRDPKEPPPPPPPEKPWSEEPSDVLHLNEENFKPVLKKKKHVLVMFYAPWCGHCKKAKPEFAEAAAEFRDNPRVELAAVDCTVDQSVCNAFDVKGYPTFKYFSYYNKESKDYSGGRTKPDFVQYLQQVSNAKPTSNEQSIGMGEAWNVDSALLKLTERNFKKELDKNRLMLVMFYAPWCEHCKRMKPDYVAAAKDMKKSGVCTLAVIDCIENPDIAQQYDIEGFPTIKLFKHGKYVADYKGKRTVDDIKQFLSKHSGKDEL
ncbi:protein disulfide-isomerase A5 [Anthonomus grandis grandis]|uniref:protein disulfide-isomerase A5 n=1 Tax=Anthonomus grandis grandis TaxID=2921223 RepID=UPI00216513CA|nr:protein disulfide-isomerase A5 [Anthonomus grandis grandis]